MSTLIPGNGGTASSTLLALSSDSLSQAQQQLLIETSVQRILRRVGAFTANDPRASQIAGETLQEVAREQSIPLPLSVALPLQNRVVALLTGYGFLDPLLPPQRTDGELRLGVYDPATGERMLTREGEEYSVISTQ